MQSQEASLLDFANRLSYHRHGWSGVYINISFLRVEVRPTGVLKDVVAKGRALAEDHQGQLFQLSNKDIVLFFKHCDTKLVDALLDKTCRPFTSDPLVRKARHEFIVRFDLEADYSDLIEMLREKKHKIEIYGENFSERPLYIDLNDPGMVQTITGHVSPNKLVRKESIFHISPGGQLDALCNGVEPLEGVLSEVMLDGIDLDSNPVLGDAGIGLMERRMLSAVPHMADPWPLPWAMGVHVTTLLSAEFIGFHRDWVRRWGAQEDVQPLFFVAMNDIRQDTKAFAFARDYIKECGYMLCLDGLSAEQADFIDLDVLGFSMARLSAPWSKEDEDSKRCKAISLALDHFGAERLIFGHVKTSYGLSLAYDLGAQLIQGPFAQKVFEGKLEWQAA